MKEMRSEINLKKSPSTRREWIEIGNVNCYPVVLMSPSTRREWIEMEKRPV